MDIFIPCCADFLVESAQKMLMFYMAPWRIYLDPSRGESASCHHVTILCGSPCLFTYLCLKNAHGEYGLDFLKLASCNSWTQLETDKDPLGTQASTLNTGASLH